MLLARKSDYRATRAGQHQDRAERKLPVLALKAYRVDKQYINLHIRLTVWARPQSNRDSALAGCWRVPPFPLHRPTTNHRHTPLTRLLKLVPLQRTSLAIQSPDYRGRGRRQDPQGWGVWGWGRGLGWGVEGGSWGVLSPTRGAGFKNVSRYGLAVRRYGKPVWPSGLVTLSITSY